LASQLPPLPFGANQCSQDEGFEKKQCELTAVAEDDVAVTGDTPTPPSAECWWSFAAWLNPSVGLF
jgi:hypothetical protein